MVVGGVKSEEVEVRVAATAPGVFSTQQTGFGPGAILKADYSLVTASNRARRSTSSTTVTFVVCTLAALRFAASCSKRRMIYTILRSRPR